MALEKLNEAYEAAAAIVGSDAADEAARESIDAFNAACFSGLSMQECEAEQLAAFNAALPQ